MILVQAAGVTDGAQGLLARSVTVQDSLGDFVGRVLCRSRICRMPGLVKAAPNAFGVPFKRSNAALDSFTKRLRRDRRFWR